jgi:hypothetical protein
VPRLIFPSCLRLRPANERESESATDGDSFHAITVGNGRPATGPIKPASKVGGSGVSDCQTERRTSRRPARSPSPFPGLWLVAVAQPRFVSTRFPLGFVVRHQPNYLRAQGFGESDPGPYRTAHPVDQPFAEVFLRWWGPRRCLCGLGGTRCSARQDVGWTLFPSECKRGVPDDRRRASPREPRAAEIQRATDE